MSLKTVRLSRSPFSYTKVWRIMTRLTRGRRRQLRRLDLASKPYLDIGCGQNTHANFVNLEYSWHPGIDLCWDILQGIPLPDCSMRGVFSEHCLEHFSPPQALFVLRECHRLLAPGGTLRIIVPDGGLYLSTYCRRVGAAGGAEGGSRPKFPFEDHGDTFGLTSPMAYVNRIFYTDRDSPAGHRTMYDEHLLREMLLASGYTDVVRSRFGEGRDPQLLIDSAHRQVESLYMEATKGPSSGPAVQN